MAAANSLGHATRAGEATAERDRLAVEKFAMATTTVGVRRVVYRGRLGEEREDFSPHLDSRRWVEALLARGEADLPVVPAVIIVGAGRVSVDTIRQLATRLPVMITPRRRQHLCHPFCISDALAYLVGPLDARERRAGHTKSVGRKV